MILSEKLVKNDLGIFKINMFCSLFYSQCIDIIDDYLEIAKEWK